MREFIFIFLSVILLSCASNRPCNPDYGKVDDEFADELIAQNQFSRAVISLDENGIDSITDEIYFNLKNGKTTKWKRYPSFKSDSSGTLTIYEYNKRENLVTEVELISATKIKTEMHPQQIEKGVWIEEESLTTINMFWRDTIKITEYGEDTTVIKHFDYYGNLTEKQLLLQNDCGYVYEIQGYDSSGSLLYITKVELNEYGWPIKTIKYENGVKKVGEKVTENYKNTGNFISEMLYLKDTIAYQIFNNFDEVGKLKSQVEDNFLKNYFITTFYNRNANGLQENMIITNRRQGKEIANDTFYYLYYK